MRKATQIAGASLLLLVCGLTPSRGQEPPPASPPTPVLPRDVIVNGPPAQRPADDPGVPPAENLFFVPGEYVPQAGQIQWRPGYWTEAQPGWNWVPDRWIRRSSGWSFLEGNWERELIAADLQIQQQAVNAEPALVRSLPAPAQAIDGGTVLQTTNAVSTVRTLDLWQPTTTTVITSFPGATTWGMPFAGPAFGSPFLNTWGTGFGGIGAVTPVIGGGGFSTLWGTGFGGIGAVTPIIGGFGGFAPGFGFGPGFGGFGPGFGGFGPGFGGFGPGFGGFGFARGGFGFGRFGFGGFRRGWGW